MSGRLRSALDAFATLAMLGAAAALIYAAVTVRKDTAGARPGTMYQVGDAFGDLPGVRFDRTKRTLIMFLQSSCKFCTESGPFYQRILSLPNRARAVVVGYESTASMQAYLEAMGVQPDQVVQVLPGMIRLVRTPTLVMVTQSGTVERVWHGQLDSDGERSVLEYVTR